MGVAGALLLALVLLCGQAASAAEQAGVSAGVHGEITLTAATASSAAGAIGRALQSGEAVFIGDRIRSGQRSGLQVMLLDETVFTMGADSEITIDRFIYDPDREAGEIAASLVSGAFRFVSGRIARARPDRVAIRVPAATIGIRGTIVAARVNGTSSEILLLGPGPRDNSGARQGRVLVETRGGSVEITRPGFGTLVTDPAAPPLEPFLFPPERVRGILDHLSHAPPQGGELLPGGVLGRGQSRLGNFPLLQFGISLIAGQLLAEGLGLGLEFLLLETLLGGAREQVLKTVQQFVTQLDLLTTFDQLRTLTGTASYSQPLTPIVGPALIGTYSFNMNVNFSARSFNYTFGNITTIGVVNIAGASIGNAGGYANLVGPAFFANPAPVPCGAAECRGFVQLLNAGERVAGQAQHSLAISQVIPIVGIRVPLGAGGGVAPRN